MLTRLRLALAFTTLALAACSGVSDDDAASAEGAVEEQSDGPRLCAAVRGNGQSILTHFASLSRIVDHYGVIDGMAGGSSASITTFVYESMLENPAIRRCADRACVEDAARVALALKSVEGYALAVGGSEEAVTVMDFGRIALKLKAEYDARGIDALASSDITEAAKKLKEVLNIPEVQPIVNPELFTMLSDTEHLAFNVNEIKTAIAQIGKFKVDDNRLFFRAGVFHWPKLAELFGRVADFYANNGSDVEGMTAWLDACAEPTRALPWAEAANVAAPGGGTCGSMFETLVSAYRAKVRSGGATGPSRIDARIGARSPLHKLVTTAVLEGAAVTEFEAKLEGYRKGAYPTGDVPFDIAFEDVNIGYWGSAADLRAAASNPSGFADLKTKKFRSLGDATWREVLSASPAEPGLSRLVQLAEGRYSGGGWSDLSPSLVLKNLGCQRVVYVTRIGDEGEFTTKIAKEFGMTEADFTAMYDLGNTESSSSRSIAEADGVWCTNWNTFPDERFREAAIDAFHAPLETRPSFRGIATLSPYPNATERLGLVGCTPGMSGGAGYPR